MKKTYWFIICAVLITALVGVASAETFDLIAGGGNVNGATDVGDVTLTVTGNESTVYYDLDEGWWLTETHVAVAKTQNQIPQKNGNPIPGKFSDTATHTYCNRIHGDREPRRPAASVCRCHPRSGGGRRRSGGNDRAVRDPAGRGDSDL